ncbi:hypothetical protein MC126_004506 [Salmonella enterica]|uniref:hypothetical protein n=1 Tax=Enterobacteriaceae TaxID=543 RepID=UPI000B95BB43|nr:hypothetical protein [Shigella sonnei]EAQ9154334.1 hypothetical protein [Salmonella enterica]EBS0352120.1 hypothetical protein [Salmonella enterica subsp. enterica serovar Java]ECD7684181.1 hypothetical protein [Salmonella enterica subsp. enterica serovar Typhimurium]EDI0517739.1 hypothetical protein [Salmonella enterica subsp. enterica serovar Stanley]EEN1859666.1 hypothetical protein [Salmonella enterica subsp. enterica serovar Enteritidis]EHY1235649.1 hypothetical protein [Escherichia c
MKVELRQKIERAIAREAIKGLLADDFKISVFDGEQTTLKDSTDAAAIEAAMFTTDEDQLHVSHQHVDEKGWVLFIYGNDGHDVIADHTTNLEMSLKGAAELADKIADEDAATLARVLANEERQ